MSRGCETSEAQSATDDVAARPAMWVTEYLTPNDAYNHGVNCVLHSATTRYQSMVVADIGTYGRALFLDGNIQTTEGDEPFYHEPIVHAPCVLKGRPQDVLILGGADGGAAREALRWHSVASVTVVDIDEQVVAACKEYLPNISHGAFDDPRCSLVIEDALDFLQRTNKTYDVIICDLTDPLERSPSLALFTRQFFQMLHDRLAPDGCVSLQSGPVSLKESTLLPRICSTLRSVFTRVYPIQLFVPTYGSPLALTVSLKRDAQLPDEEQVDAVFKRDVSGDMHVLDGRAFRGLFAVPKCLTEAIRCETAILDDSCNGKAFGRGIL